MLPFTLQFVIARTADAALRWQAKSWPQKNDGSAAIL